MYRYILQLMLHCSLLWTYCLRFLTKSPAIPHQLYKIASRSLSAIAELLVCTRGSNNWETIEDRWVHAARGSANIELSFHPCNILRDNHRGVSRGNKNVGWGRPTWKRRFFCTCGSIKCFYFLYLLLFSMFIALCLWFYLHLFYLLSLSVSS